MYDSLKNESSISKATTFSKRNSNPLLATFAIQLYALETGDVLGMRDFCASVRNLKILLVHYPRQPILI